MTQLRYRCANFSRLSSVVSCLFLSVSCASQEGSNVGNNSESEVIDEKGGAVSLGAARVTIPAGAVNEPTQVSVSVTGNPPAPAPDGWTLSEPAYMVTPHGHVFAEEITVSLPIENEAGRLWTLADPEDESWEEVANAVTAEGAVQFTTLHFSYFAWLSPASPDGGGDSAGVVDADVLEASTPAMDATLNDDSQADGAGQ